MTALDTVPLFLHSQNFSKVKDNLLFYDYSQIDYLRRVVNLVQAVFYDLVRSSVIAQECWRNAWTGCQGNWRGFDPEEAHQWQLLLKTNLQGQLVLRSTNWAGVLGVCPETFEFAPDDVKQDPKLITLAVRGNPAMIRFVDKGLLNEAFVKQLAEAAPRLVLFLEEELKGTIIASLSDEQKLKAIPDLHTKMSTLEKEQLKYLVDTCGAVWKSFFTASKGTSFLYLKRGKIGSPHTMHVRCDGNVSIHVHQACISLGATNKVKLINIWDKDSFADFQLAKISVCTKNLLPANKIDRQLKGQIACYKMLKGRRGIVQLEDTFIYPTKFPNQQKTVLIQELYTYSCRSEEIPQKVIDLWTRKDVEKLTLDLFYGLKAFEDNRLYDKTFNLGNVLVKLDEEGRVIKAGLTVSRGIEQLPERAGVSKEYWNAWEQDYSGSKDKAQTRVIEFVFSIYKKKNLIFPEILKEGFSKKSGSDRGLEIFDPELFAKREKLQNPDPPVLGIGAIIQKLEVDDSIVSPYCGRKITPTKSLAQIVTELESHPS